MEEACDETYMAKKNAQTLFRAKEDMTRTVRCTLRVDVQEATTSFARKSSHHHRDHNDVVDERLPLHSMAVKQPNFPKQSTSPPLVLQGEDLSLSRSHFRSSNAA